MRCRAVFCAAVLAGLALDMTEAAASDRSDAVAFIRSFARAGNGTDRRAYGAYCAEDAVVLDHVPPYVFRGPNACEAEWDAVVVWVERQKVKASDYGTLGEPSFVDVADDRVYAVFPVTARLTRNGREEIERATWTFVARRQAGGWRISSFAWSTRGFEPVATRRKPAGARCRRRS